MSEAMTPEQALDAVTRLHSCAARKVARFEDGCSIVAAPTPHQWIEAEDAVAKGLPVLRAALPRWIPVEERLPEEDHCHVLMAADSGLVCSTFYSVIGHEAKHYTDNVSALFEHAATFCYRVTHWMPLPAPPTQEAQE